jgi:mercuric reductase
MEEQMSAKAKKQMRMTVQGMTCDDCNRHVAHALKTAGATDARADYRRGEALFTLAGDDTAALVAAVKDAGYRPERIEVLEEASPRPPVPNGSQDSYDLAIVGSGSAAFAAAIRARDLGARVAMVEAGTIGGTCVNVGCVPSKAVLRASEVHYEAGHHGFAGITTRAGKPDLAAVVAQKDELVAALRQEKYADLVEAYGFDFTPGKARFTGPAELAVDRRPLRADRVLIATGASPWAPPIPGLEEAGYLTSTTALDLKELPRSLAVIGGNAIGLEIGQYFANLGSRVTILEVLPRIAPFEEPDVSAGITRVLEEEGMRVITGAEIEQVARSAGKITVRGRADGKPMTVRVDQLLVATGRRANTADLGLDAAGVQLDPRGSIVVDETLRTTNPRVWAAGDCTPAPQFVYVAAYEGALAVDNAIGGKSRTVDFRALPRVTFTRPQIASAGLTEEQAREEGYEVRVSTMPLDVIPRALVNRETRGVFKLVADAKTDQLLGAHILAESAGEVIASAVYAIKFRLTISDLAETFHPYLTMAEGMKLAAQTFTRDVAKLSCCAA